MKPLFGKRLLSISDYINEFERLLNKTKQYGIAMSINVLAYRLLKSTNLSETHEQLEGQQSKN